MGVELQPVQPPSKEIEITPPDVHDVHDAVMGIQYGLDWPNRVQDGLSISAMTSREKGYYDMKQLSSCNISEIQIQVYWLKYGSADERSTRCYHD